MSPPAIDYQRLHDHLQPDGSLRDIYVQQADGRLWQRFLMAVTMRAPYRYLFRHGERSIPKPLGEFSEAAKLRETNSVLLQIELAPALTVNCHFFTEEEIELDVDPHDLQSPDAVAVLIDFLKWLTDVVERPVLLTHENSPECVILRIQETTGRKA